MPTPSARPRKIPFKGGTVDSGMCISLAASFSTPRSFLCFYEAGKPARMNGSYSHHPVRYSRCGGSGGQIVKRQFPASARLAFKPLLHSFAAFIFWKPFHRQPFLALGAICQRLAGYKRAALWNNSFVMRSVFFTRPPYMRSDPCFPISAMFYPPHL